MRILIISFYYPPDLSAGSFRTVALVQQLRERLGPGDTIRVITTQPNRYASFREPAASFKEDGGVSVERIELPAHKSNFADQSLAYMRFAREAMRRCRSERPDLVFATSSRLMTAALGAEIARRTRSPLYLDIRDLFTDTMRDLLHGPARALMPVMRMIERRAFRRAGRINIVSPGFADHIAAIRGNEGLSALTNGIDQEFLEADFTAPPNDPPVILYAGNIGQGQGLDLIVPQAAQRLAGRYRFRIIGDGGARLALEQAIAGLGDHAAAAVDMRKPVGRAELLKEYRDADILFLHLNAHKAFEKVIPSKIFEYAATGKPVLAGIQGTSRAFLEKNVVNARCFDPCDAEGLVKAVSELNPKSVDRADFKRHFSRDAIMSRMADELIEYARAPRVP